MQPETIRQFEESLWAFIPRAVVVMLFVGWQSWVGYLVWLRLHVLGPNAGVLVLAFLLFVNVLLSAWLAYYYRSTALILAAVGWMIVSVSSLLFAVGYGVATLLWMGAALHVVLLLLGLRYCRISGVGEASGRSAGAARIVPQNGTGMPEPMA